MAVKQRRLAPQPTDTRLARFVRRVVDLFPGATVGWRRGAELRLAALQILCAKQARAYDDLSRDHAVLSDDLRRLMVNMRPAPLVSGSLHLCDDKPAKILTHTVYFESIQLASEIIPDIVRRPAVDLRAYTIHLMRHHARALAQRHADEVERKIFDTSLTFLNAKEAPRDRSSV